MIARHKNLQQHHRVNKLSVLCVCVGPVCCFCCTSRYNVLSRQYVRPAYGAKGPGSNVGVMFLCEAALGKEASITVDDWKLTKPPKV